MPGGEHQYESMPLFLGTLMRIEECFLFSCVGTPTNHHRVIGERSNQIDRQRRLVDRWIEFQIARNANTILPYTECDKSFGIQFGSRTYRIDPPERRSHDAPNSEISWKRTIRQASRRHDDRNPVTCRSSDPYGPQFGLDQHGHSRPRTPQCTIHEPRMIKGSETRWHHRQIPFEKLSARYRRSCRSHSVAIRVELADQPHSSLRLPDTRGVNLYPTFIPFWPIAQSIA